MCMYIYMHKLCISIYNKHDACVCVQCTVILKEIYYSLFSTVEESRTFWKKQCSPNPVQLRLIKSETSARVGTGFSIMLSTICVAVITNSPACLARWMRSFCAKGTRFRPSSTPRSPRATMSAWDFAMMPSMLVKAFKCWRKPTERV